MTITANEGATVLGIVSAPISGMPTGTNPETGPSMAHMGLALMDSRGQFTYVPGQNFGKPVCGWIGGLYQTIDQVPYTATINNIAAAQTATAGTALTLVSASATGITAGVSIVRADTGATVTGLLAIDSAMTTVSYGSSGTIQIWDPTRAISRNIRVSSNANDTSGTYTIRGYDIYGFPLTETITGANGTAGTAAIASGVKAFKYIASVTPAATVNSTAVTIGTGDVIGLPLRADRFGELLGMLGNTSITASTGFTAAVSTVATATSGDVRGTYALQTASNGVNRVALKQSPLAANINTTAGLTGVSQYSA